MCDRGLTDSKVKCITVIQLKYDEGVDYCFKVLYARKGLPFASCLRWKKLNLTCTNLPLQFKITFHLKTHIWDGGLHIVCYRAQGNCNCITLYIIHYVNTLYSINIRHQNLIISYPTWYPKMLLKFAYLIFYKQAAKQTNKQTPSET